MKKNHLLLWALSLTIGQMFYVESLVAQQPKNQQPTVVAVRKFSGFSKILSIDTLIHDLNVLNNDKSVLYVKFIGGNRADYIVDVNADYSFPKKMVKQTFGTLTDIASPGGAIYNSDEIYVPNYSGEVRGVRTIGAYYNNEFSLYDYKVSGIGIGTVSLTISLPGIKARPVYKKAVYLEDTALLIEESLFDEVVSNMFSYVGRQADPQRSLY